MKNRILWLLLHSQTSALRWWFSFFSFLYGIDIISSPWTNTHGVEHSLMFKLAPFWVWGILYFLHAGSVMYGVLTRKFSNYQLFIEGVLGTALWSATAISAWEMQGAPEISLAGAFVALWLLVRYPTHWEKNHE
jgi:hypothetical protein